jgi:hypothetical protein
MLSPDEFTVGTLASAKAGSLLLPRTKYEETVLIGETDEGPTAVFLSGQFRFQCFQTSGANNWKGLIIPGVRVEVDEKSLFDPDAGGSPLGAVVRIDTRLVVRAKTDHSFGRAAKITLQSGLASAHEDSAGFAKWCVVIGEAPNKRVLVTVDLGPIDSN